MRTLLILLFSAFAATAQTPPIEPGVSHELAKWRAARYSDIRYKLNLTLEKMSPVLKGTIEIRVRVSSPTVREGAVTNAHPTSTQTAASASEPRAIATGLPIVLDWRRIRGSENLSTISNVSLNGVAVKNPVAIAPGSDPIASYEERDEHLIFRDGVVEGENVIKLDFTSPILTSGSAITRYVDKEDGAEYIYSLFVPSDASTAFPVFDQPDLKARFGLTVRVPKDWTVISNGYSHFSCVYLESSKTAGCHFEETKPISTYVFAFAAGPWERVSSPTVREGLLAPPSETGPSLTVGLRTQDTSIYVRKSQAAKFKPHAAEVFRLNREGIKYLETYFDYKFPFPKYDLVLIPEFPFGGMEHAGATFLRESSVIFPQEPTKNDYFTRANLIFHEAAHQWFGDTVTMKWFDDLWLKEGFAEFMAYKTSAEVMPEYNAWKVFYERNKQAAYLTDSTKGTTPIYQEIANLNAAKSAYGNIVYRKAPSFLKQAEFYLGPDKFQTAVRAFLKKYEYGNAGWEDLVKEFETASGQNLKEWATAWVKTPGVPIYYSDLKDENFIKNNGYSYGIVQEPPEGVKLIWPTRTKLITRTFSDGRLDQAESTITFGAPNKEFSGRGIVCDHCRTFRVVFNFANYQDYGYGIFLLDDKSRDYVLKNIGSEKDDFLRTMMWGSLWDSVREGELDPKEYVELVLRNIKPETDESTVQTLLGRVSLAMRYYIDAPPASESEPPASAGGTNAVTKQVKIKPRPNNRSALPPAYAGGSDLATRLEDLLLDRLQNAPTPGLRITYYRAFVANATTDKSREVLKQMLEQSFAGGLPRPATKTSAANAKGQPPATAGGSDSRPRTKDRFDIVTRLIILGDPEALKLLADLEKTETSDEAKRYAYAARAGIATAENKAKYWNDLTSNKDISESWIEAAFASFNSVRHSELTLPYLERALKELPNHKRNRKIFFINGWLASFIGGQRSEEALNIVNKFLADNPDLDRDLRLKILENVDLIERAVKIRSKRKPER